MNTHRNPGAEYKHIYENYKTHLTSQGDIPFSTYCSQHNKPYKTIKSWLGAQGLSIKTARGITRAAPSPKDSTNNSTPDTLRLIPLTVPANHNYPEQQARNLRITLTCGTTIEIGELNIPSLKELIR